MVYSLEAVLREMVLRVSLLSMSLKKCLRISSLSSSGRLANVCMVD